MIRNSKYRILVILPNGGFPRPKYDTKNPEYMRKPPRSKTNKGDILNIPGILSSLSESFDRTGKSKTVRGSKGDKMIQEIKNENKSVNEFTKEKTKSLLPGKTSFL